MAKVREMAVNERGHSARQYVHSVGGCDRRLVCGSGGQPDPGLRHSRHLEIFSEWRPGPCAADVVGAVALSMAPEGRDHSHVHALPQVVASDGLVASVRPRALRPRSRCLRALAYDGHAHDISGPPAHHSSGLLARLADDMDTLSVLPRCPPPHWSLCENCVQDDRRHHQLRSRVPGVSLWVCPRLLPPHGWLLHCCRRTSIFHVTNN
mmetsp:Transcript_36300/g.82739  ORF Transcript_36300/g.82739 Transcript_36300/m.82739 type:complete len:208 (+) Transcript_36300:1351-1974(+)